MNKLLLFDIDGTLVTSKHDDRHERAINKAHGLETKLEGDFQGYTDYLILAVLLKNDGWTEEQIAQAMPSLLDELNAVHQDTFRGESMQVLPGVERLLETLKKTDCILGLITGNHNSIAERKLSAVNLWHYFEVGGYGNDPHVSRADLVSVAVKRAGYKDNLDDVCVIGDTARDIKAAHDAGVVNSVGVVNGFRDRQELVDANAKIILEDFTDTENVLAKLGLSYEPRSQTSIKQENLITS